MAEIKQRIVSCPQGHYFDANAYSSCPLCGGSAIGGGGAKTVIPNVQGRSSFGETITPGQQGNSFDATITPNGFGGASAGSHAGGSGVFGDTTPPNDYASPVPEATPRRQVGNAAFGPTEAVKRSSKGEFSHTIAIDSSTKPGHVPPVVGWIVALNGPCRGTDYRIHANYNYIGREEGDICVHGDHAISAVRDSSIAYVARTDRFYIAHEQGLNTVLVNDVPVMGGGCELNDHDILTIGGTQFIFIRLSGPGFSWEDWQERVDG